MLKSLREALAQYALGDDGEPGPGGGDGIVTPIEEYLAAFLQALEAAENHLKSLGFDPARLTGAKGFTRIQALRDAVDALYTSDEAKRRFEIMAREVFSRFKALLMEPSALQYAVRHDNIETIYKKLEERRDTADVTEVLKELHRIVNEAIRAQEPGDDQMDSKLFDMSQIDLAKLRDEFAKKAEAQSRRRSGHPRTGREEAGPDARSEPPADGLLQEVPGDHRRLQPRERPRHHRRNLRPAG